MRQWNRIALAAGIALAVGGLFLALGCGKDKSTNPGGVGLELDSPNIPQNGTYQHTFAAAETVAYHCSIHTTMHGTVHVRDGETLIANATINGFVFSPNPIVVGPGGTVTWTNQDATAHTVTSDSAIP